MFSNLSGWHVIVLIVVVLLIVAAIIAALFIASALARRGGPNPGNVAGRLKKLDRLRDTGVLSDAEYQSKRTEILGLL